jgi:hypothetical protein
MADIAYSDLLNLTNAPTGVPYRFGLFSVAQFEPISDHDRAGVTWRSDACQKALITQDICKDPAAQPLTASSCGYTGEAAPFFAYLHDDDSIPAASSLADHEGRARARFLTAEQWGVENHVAGMLDAAAVAAGTIVDMTAALDTGGSFASYDHASVMLAQVEAQLALMSGNDGVIYMSRFSAILLDTQLTTQGGTLRTRLGTPVVSMGGWPTVTKDALPTSDVIYGTGPIKAQRGEVEIFGGTPALRLNDVAITVERAYTFGWDCGIVGASIDF